MEQQNNKTDEKGRGASTLMRGLAPREIDLTTLIDDVMPENSLLWKDSGTWYFYEGEKAFEKCEWPKYAQEVNETFDQFVRRVIENIVKEEEKREDEEPLVSIDLAIARE